jgi:hypothetical protein
VQTEGTTHFMVPISAAANADPDHPLTATAMSSGPSRVKPTATKSMAYCIALEAGQFSRFLQEIDEFRMRNRH